MSVDLEKIWLDSLKECKAHLDRITFDDFKRLMKGQPKETAAPSFRLDANALLKSERSLQPVPEDITASRLDVSALLMRSAGISERSLQPVQEGIAQILADIPAIPEEPHSPVKSRSRSFDQDFSSYDDFSKSSPTLSEHRDASLALSFRSKIECELPGLVTDLSMSPLVVNRALYRKHREMRLAVLEASKQFDLTRVQRRSEEFAQAGLIMKRGKLTPVELEDAHQKALFDAATKKSGRVRRTRNKTVSDVSNMLFKAEA